MMLGGTLQGHHASQSEEEGVVKAGMGRSENVILSLMSYGRTEEREQRSSHGKGRVTVMPFSPPAPGTQMAEFLNSSFDEFPKKGQLRGLDWLPKSRSAEAPHQGVCVWELGDPRKQKPRAVSHRPWVDDRRLLLPLSRSFAPSPTLIFRSMLCRLSKMKKFSQGSL